MATSSPSHGHPSQSTQNAVLFHDRIPLRLAAKRLGVTFWTLRNWTAKGLIASFQLGGRIYFKPSELERFVRDSERPAQKQAVTHG